MSNVLITSASRKVWLVRAFQRAVRAEGGGIVIAVDASPYSPALYAADRGFLVPRGLGDDFFSRVLDIASAHDVSLIVPTRDEELAEFAHRKPMFADAGITVAVADERAIQVCQDKLAFAKFCLDSGFSVPRILDISVAHQHLPVFIRERTSKGGQRAFRVNTIDELRFVRGVVRHPIVQEFIDAEEYTVDVFADFSANVLSVVPRLRMRTLAGESVVGKTVRHSQIANETVNLIHSLGLVGFATIQCFWHQGSVKFIEVNPRIGGGANLSITAGADTPRMALRVAGRKPVECRLGEFKDGLVMLRHSSDIFLQEDELLSEY